MDNATNVSFDASRNRDDDLSVPFALTNAMRKKAKRKTKNDEYEQQFAYSVTAQRLPKYSQQFVLRNSRFMNNARKHHRFDGCFEEYRLLIEIDGGIWMKGGGAHSHPVDIERNMKKQNDATLFGYCVLRFTPAEVMNGEAMRFTQKTLFKLGWRGVAAKPRLNS